MYLNEQKMSQNNKRRATLIRNAYLGLEKVENCHKVKAQRMKDQQYLQNIISQCEKDRYNIIINSFRSQEKTRSRLEHLINLTRLKLAKASGENAEEIQRSVGQPSGLTAVVSGPSQLDELAFARILEEKRQRVMNMRKSQNYSQRNKTKSFWEMDKDFYQNFNGALENPLAELDGMMKHVQEEETHLTRQNSSQTLPKLVKSVVLINRFTGNAKRSSCRSLPNLSKKKEKLVPSIRSQCGGVKKNETFLTSSQTEDLNERMNKFCEEVQKFTDQDQSKLSLLTNFEPKHYDRSPTPVELDVLALSLKGKAAQDWKNIYSASLVRSLTWTGISSTP